MSNQCYNQWFQVQKRTVLKVNQKVQICIMLIKIQLETALTDLQRQVWSRRFWLSQRVGVNHHKCMKLMIQTFKSTLQTSSCRNSKVLLFTWGQTFNQEHWMLLLRQSIIKEEVSLKSDWVRSQIIWTGHTPAWQRLSIKVSLVRELHPRIAILCRIYSQ